MTFSRSDWAIRSRGRTRRAACLWVVLATVAAACGSSQQGSEVSQVSESSQPTASSEPTAAPTPTTDPVQVVVPTATVAPVPTATPVTEIEPTAASTPAPTSAVEVTPSPEPDPEPTASPPVTPGAITTGAEALVAGDFAEIAGPRVGLIGNHTSQVDGVLLAELLAAHPAVNLTALFAPEHGVFGTEQAGVLVGDGQLAGVPVFSLYGDTLQPTGAMMAEVDVLLFDLQDAGSRTYTFIATMGLAMQAAAANDVTFVVLDRPNPVGGVVLDGPLLNPAFSSFVGQYPIPVAHGMTVGELALAIKGEGWLSGLENLDLSVIAMEGWDANLMWPQTGEQWVAPSPGLPSAASAVAYPGTVFFEATTASFGKGTDGPFTRAGAPWVDGQAMAAELNNRGLSAGFEPTSFVPTSNDASPSPRLEGVEVFGVDIVPLEGFDPVEVGVHLLDVFQQQAVAAQVPFVDRPDFFDLLAGTDQLRTQLVAGTPAADIVASWQPDLASFDQLRQPYLLYPR